MPDTDRRNGERFAHFQALQPKQQAEFLYFDNIDRDEAIRNLTRRVGIMTPVWAIIGGCAAVGLQIAIGAFKGHSTAIPIFLEWLRWIK